jgi:hypothetical protein
VVGDPVEVGIKGNDLYLKKPKGGGDLKTYITRRERNTPDKPRANCGLPVATELGTPLYHLAMTLVDQIYLNKRGNRSFTNVWAYYRITSFGEEGDHIELCLVKWPTFEDIDEVAAADKAVVVNPGDTGFASAYPNILTVLKSKWNIDHSDDDLIGLRFRDV